MAPMAPMAPMMGGGVMVDFYPSSTTKTLLKHPHLSDYAALPKLAVEEKVTGPSDIIRETIKRNIDSGIEDAFFVVDLGAVVRQHKKWVRNLPRVSPFYAIKCNTDRQVLKTLVPLCTGFDCASMGEISTMLELGVAPENIIFANPCKAPAHIQYAREQGVHLMTFDNADELRKVQAINPDAKMVLRIITDDSKSVCRFGTKFGAHLNTTRTLLQTAKSLGVEVVGVSFHVGSGCMDPMAYDDAVRRAKGVFEEAESLGFHMSLLDVGGGFPGTEKEQGSDRFGQGTIRFEDIASALSQALDKYFPEPSAVKVIGEPGRYYAAAAFTLATCITSRRVTVTQPETKTRKHGRRHRASGSSPTRRGAGSKSVMYYTNDGVYGSFNCLLFDHAVANPKVLTQNTRMVADESECVGPLYESSVWGPTCDSMDVITKKARLPELAIGDWLYYEEMGAYTVAAASRFNGFNLSQCFYINTEGEWA